MKAALVLLDNMKTYVRGGIGDILQSWNYIQSNPDLEYIVHSHYSNVKEIFEYLKAKNCHFYSFSDFSSHNEQVDAIVKDFGQGVQQETVDIPRVFYSTFQFSFVDEELSLSAFESFEKEQYTVGIHPFRSGFARSVYKDHGLPCDVMHSEILEALIEPDKNYLIFGSDNELKEVELKESDNVKFVSFNSILTSLNTVKYCKKFIGLDSCFKSMSSMQRIPTLCIIGDFQDEVRDKMFLNQYVKDGVMDTVRVRNLVLEEDMVIDRIKTFINNDS